MNIVNILEKRNSNDHLKKMSVVESEARRENPGKVLQELERDILQLTNNAFTNTNTQSGQILTVECFIDILRFSVIGE